MGNLLGILLSVLWKERRAEERKHTQNMIRNMLKRPKSHNRPQHRKAYLQAEEAIYRMLPYAIMRSPEGIIKETDPASSKEKYTVALVKLHCEFNLLPLISWSTQHTGSIQSTISVKCWQ